MADTWQILLQTSGIDGFVLRMLPWASRAGICFSFPMRYLFPLKTKNKKQTRKQHNRPQSTFSNSWQVWKSYLHVHSFSLLYKSMLLSEAFFAIRQRGTGAAMPAPDRHLLSSLPTGPPDRSQMKSHLLVPHTTLHFGSAGISRRHIYHIYSWKYIL